MKKTIILQSYWQATNKEESWREVLKAATDTLNKAVDKATGDCLVLKIDLLSGMQSDEEEVVMVDTLEKQYIEAGLVEKQK